MKDKSILLILLFLASCCLTTAMTMEYLDKKHDREFKSAMESVRECKALEEGTTFYIQLMNGKWKK